MEGLIILSLCWCTEAGFFENYWLARFSLPFSIALLKFSKAITWEPLRMWTVIQSMLWSSAGYTLWPFWEADNSVTRFSSVLVLETWFQFGVLSWFCLLLRIECFSRSINSFIPYFFTRSPVWTVSAVWVLNTKSTRNLNVFFLDMPKIYEFHN